jgi:hypothetical protein
MDHKIETNFPQTWNGHNGYLALSLSCYLACNPYVWARIDILEQRDQLHVCMYVRKYVCMCGIMYVCACMCDAYAGANVCMRVCMFPCMYRCCLCVSGGMFMYWGKHRTCGIMYVCMYVSKNVCMCNTYVGASINILEQRDQLYACLFVCMYVCAELCMHACRYVCMYVCTYVCVYVCMCVSMYARAHVAQNREKKMNIQAHVYICIHKSMCIPWNL